ncbi:HPr kinase [alpha proteobacterium BAL199]|nr:HPr kinase [alpha proteobacterium BAL199]
MTENETDKRTLPKLPDHVSLHFMGSQGLLLDAHRQLLFSATPAATLVWCCLAEFDSRAEVLSELRQRTGLSARRAANCIDEAVQSWRTAGLFDTPGSALPSALPEPVEFDRDAPAPAVPTIVPSSEAAYRLLDTTFAIAFSDPTLREAVDPVIRHLQTAPVARPDAVLVVARDDGGFVVSQVDVGQVRCGHIDEVAPLVHTILAHAAVHRADALCAIHAGAVSVGEGCVLLAGEAGAGKSTLVSGLAAAGWRALCDDTVLLSNDTLEVRPLCGALGVKAGSWPILSDAFPELLQSPVNLRSDGRAVRYLSRNPHPLDRDRYPVHRIVFPRYDAGAGRGSLEELAPATALTRLMKCAYFLEHPLSPELMERLIQWIAGIDCFEMRYASLADSVRLFRKLD